MDEGTTNACVKDMVKVFETAPEGKRIPVVPAYVKDMVKVFETAPEGKRIPVVPANPPAQKAVESKPSSSHMLQPIQGDQQLTCEDLCKTGDADSSGRLREGEDPNSTSCGIRQEEGEGSNQAVPCRTPRKLLPGWKQPRMFIETDENGRPMVNEKTKMCLEEISEPVVVVSVVGLYRTGKSFLLNRLVRLVLADEDWIRGKKFSLGATVESKTKGIWIWVIPHPKRDDCRLVLLDTEGLGAVEKGKLDHDIWIFALGILLSGTFVYNSKGAIDQKAMSDLHLVTEVAQLIQVKSRSNDNDIGVDEAGRNPVTSSSGSKDDELQKFFPKFVWALRDFTLQLTIKGQKLTSDEYLEHALASNIPEAPGQGPGLKGGEMVNPKDCIKDYFPQRRCFAFPIPVENTKLMDKIDVLEDHNFDQQFLKEMEDFCDYTFSESQVKTVFGDITTGRALARLAAIYVESIRDGNAPCIQNAVQTTAKIENEQAIKESVDLYIKRFEASVTFPTETLNEMCDCHAKCSNEAFDFFLTKSVFDSKRLYYLELAEEITKIYAGFAKDNEIQSEEACKKQLENLHEKIAGNDYLFSGGYSKYEADMQELVDTYEKTPHLQEVAARMLKEFKDSKKHNILRQLIWKVDEKLTEAEKKETDLKAAQEAKEFAEKAMEEEQKKFKLLKEEFENSRKEHEARLIAKAEEERKIKRSEEEDDAMRKVGLQNIVGAIGLFTNSIKMLIEPMSAIRK